MIDGIELDQALLGSIATEPRLMPHLHLSLQAGDDMILKRMKRRHLRDGAIRFNEDAPNLAPRHGVRRRSDRRVPHGKPKRCSSNRWTLSPTAA